MIKRTKELLAMLALALLMAAWIAGATAGFFSRMTGRADLTESTHVLTPTATSVLVACACMAILVVIANFIRAIRREALASASEARNK